MTTIQAGPGFPLRTALRHFLRVTLLSVGVLFAGPGASTLSITVNSTGDGIDTTPCATGASGCTLRAAVMYANQIPGPDTIYIQSGVSPIFLTRPNSNGDDPTDTTGTTGDIDIIESVDIIGQSNTSGGNIIDANSGSRIFDIHGAIVVEMQNLTLQDGCVINDSGGALRLEGNESSAASEVRLTSVTVRNNTAINTSNCSPSADTSTDANTVTSISFTVNGGGINVGSNAKLTLINSSVSANIAPGGGGIGNFGKLEVRSNTTIDRNTANNGLGGGIYNFGGYVTVADSQITDNRAVQGGGLYHSAAGQNEGSVTISNSTIDRNRATFLGGGIFNSATMAINNSTVTGNETGQGDGGGIINWANGSLSVENATISQNHAARAGGGIMNQRDLSLNHVTLYDNQAPLPFAIVDGRPVGGNQLVVYKSGSTSAIVDPNVNVRNTIIADGPHSYAQAGVCYGSAGYTAFIDSLGFNLQGHAMCGLATATDLTIADPKLGILYTSNNEPGDPNPTNDTATHRPLADSPVINPAGRWNLDASNRACYGLDQRYRTRDSDCDIGAYEYGSLDIQAANYVDLKVTLTDAPDPVSVISASNPSAQLRYTVVVQNLYNTPATALGVELTVTLPAGVTLAGITDDSVSYDAGSECTLTGNIVNCTLPDMNSLDRLEIYIAVEPRAAGTITATASVNSLYTNDAFAGNNAATATTVVTDAPASQNSGFSTSGGGGGADTPWVWVLLGGAGFWWRRRR